jgi:hypothetical protein
VWLNAFKLQPSSVVLAVRGKLYWNRAARVVTTKQLAVSSLLLPGALHRSLLTCARPSAWCRHKRWPGTTAALLATRPPTLGARPLPQVGANVLTAKVSVAGDVSAFDADLHYTSSGGGALPAALGADAPAGLRAASSATDVSLHWSRPACLTGTGISGYSVSVLDISSGKAFRSASVAARSTKSSYSYVVTGLQPCKRYRVAVAAESPAGRLSAASSEFKTSCSSAMRGL